MLKWIVNGFVVLVIGGAFWLSQEEQASVPGGGAPFVFMIWIICGLPVSFVLYPLAYRGAQYLASPLKWIALPAVVMATVLVATVAAEEPIDNDFLVQFAIAVQISWLVYVKGVENWPRYFDPVQAVLFLVALLVIFIF